jgi:hypothetical protein
MNLRHEESKSGSFKVLADQTPRVADNLLLPRRESGGRIHFRVTCAEDHGERPNGGSCAHHDAHFRRLIFLFSCSLCDGRKMSGLNFQRIVCGGEKKIRRWRRRLYPKRRFLRSIATRVA